MITRYVVNELSVMTAGDVRPVQVEVNTKVYLYYFANDHIDA